MKKKKTKLVFAGWVIRDGKKTYDKTLHPTKRLALHETFHVAFFQNGWTLREIRNLGYRAVKLYAEVPNGKD